MKLTNGKVYLMSMAVTTACMLVFYKVTYVPRYRPPERKVIREIDLSGIYLTDQLWEYDFAKVSQMKIATIVDMRPDGEVEDQLPSKRVAELSKELGIKFEYIPIPHGDIPSTGVDKLASVLTKGKRPILMYCRTGKRALRTFCLADAGRKNGHTAEELNTIVSGTEFDIEDLKPEIARRIAARGSK